jgi:hypothetical protein
VRSAVGEALAPVQLAFRDIQRRLDDLERRPVTVAASAPPITVPAPMRPPQATYPGGAAAPGSVVPVSVAPASIVPIPVTVASIAPRPPIFDIAAIERDVSIQIDGAIDGRRRKRRLALTFVLVLLVLFGGLFAALANSYAPHPATFAPTKRGDDAITRLAQAPVTQKGTSISTYGPMGGVGMTGLLTP